MPAGVLAVCLFGDATEERPTATLRWEGAGGTSGPLMAREMDVLRYLALG